MRFNERFFYWTIFLFTVNCPVSAAETAIVPATIALEASGESVHGQMAVGWVILNRVRDCGTTPEFEALRPYQFSCWNTDPQTSAWRRRRMSALGWPDELATATTIWQKLVATHASEDFTHGSTHYHSTKIRPYWADSLQKTVTIGRHVFYRKITNPVTCKVVDTHTHGDEPSLTNSLTF